MNEQATRLKITIGFFVLASLIALAVLITLFGGFPGYFKKAQTYTLVFDNAQGVTPGTPVLRSGVRIGEVRSVKLDNVTGKVQVGIMVEDGFTLRRGDRATLVRGLLGGDTSIAFLPPPDDGKKVDAAPVEPGAVLPGYAQADAGLLLQRTADLIVPAQETLVEMRRLVQNVDKMTPLMEQTLTEFRDLAKAGKTLAPELQKTNEEIRDLTRATRQLVPQLEKTNNEFQALTKSAREVVPEFKKTGEEVQQTSRTWGKVGERVDVLLQTNEQKIVKSLEQLQDALRRTNEVLSDQNIRNLTDTLKNVRTGSDRIDSIARGTDELLKDSRVTVKQLNDTMRRLDSVLTDVQKSTAPLGERGPVIMKNLDESAAKLNRALTDVTELVRVIARSDGTVQRLLADPALYNNLNDAACMITRVLPRVDRILRDVEIFADKIARHPEALGVGGAIRPSSGLKEAPSSIYPWRPTAMPHP